MLNGYIILSTPILVNTKFAAELGYLESCYKVKSFATICKQQPVKEHNDAIYCDVMITIMKEIMVHFNIFIMYCSAYHKPIGLAQHTLKLPQLKRSGQH